MKQRELVNKIGKAAKTAGIEWVLLRHGASHDIYQLGNTMIPVPRHTEIGERTGEGIYKECETQLGNKWWRK